VARCWQRIKTSIAYIDNESIEIQFCSAECPKLTYVLASPPRPTPTRFRQVGDYVRLKDNHEREYNRYGGEDDEMVRCFARRRALKDCYSRSGPPHMADGVTRRCRSGCTRATAHCVIHTTLVRPTCSTPSASLYLPVGKLYLPVGDALYAAHCCPCRHSPAQERQRSHGRGLHKAHRECLAAAVETCGARNRAMNATHFSAFAPFSVSHELCCRKANPQRASPTPTRNLLSSRRVIPPSSHPPLLPLPSDPFPPSFRSRKLPKSRSSGSFKLPRGTPAARLQRLQSIRKKSQTQRFSDLAPTSAMICYTCAAGAAARPRPCLFTLSQGCSCASVSAGHTATASAPRPSSTRK
jgi:hypothetical protein